MKPLIFDSHFKDLFENTSDLIHFVGIEGEIEIVNTSWLQTLHYELYEVVGRSIYEFIHPDYVEKFKAHRELMIQDKQPRSLQTAYITKSGQTTNCRRPNGCLKGPECNNSDQ